MRTRFLDISLQRDHQVNQKLLQNQGPLIEAPTSIQPTWPETTPRSNGSRIVIKAIDHEMISINGKPCPATEEDVKKGLIACLKEMGKIR